jgi:hypothetical protein
MAISSFRHKACSAALQHLGKFCVIQTIIHAFTFSYSDNEVGSVHNLVASVGGPWCQL